MGHGIAAEKLSCVRPRFAPKWDEPLQYALGYLIWTRMIIDTKMGLCVAVCENCKKNPRKAHFHSVVWPCESLEHTEDISDVHWGGNEYIGSRTTWHFPCQRNMFFMNPVRLFDLSVSGVRVCKRPSGIITNIKLWPLLEITVVLVISLCLFSKPFGLLGEGHGTCGQIGHVGRDVVYHAY